MEHGRRFPGIPELEEQAVGYIRENGPVSSDTLPIGGTIFWHSSMHWSGNWHKESQASRSVLEQLYTDGVLLIHHKSGSRKYYDLADKYLPEDLLNVYDAGVSIFVRMNADHSFDLLNLQVSGNG